MLNVKDRLARIDGVGDVQLYGAGDYSMRVWVDPQKAIALAQSVTGDYMRDDRDLGPGVDARAMVLEWLGESADLARYVVYTVGEERPQPPFVKAPEAYRTLANQIARHGNRPSRALPHRVVSTRSTGRSADLASNTDRTAEGSGG